MKLTSRLLLIWARRGGMSNSRKLSLTALGLLAVAMLVVAVAPADGGYPVAPDVVVFCEPTLQHAINDVGTLWSEQTGVAVRVFTSPTSALLGQIAHHARDDVLIGEGDAQARAATAQNLIKPQTLQRLGRNQLVVAALERDAAHARPAAAVQLTALAGKATVAIVDPWAATAGADSKAALQSLGLWETVGSKSVGVVDTADASFLLARGDAKLALVYATDVAANPELAIAERLPEASYPPVVYWVALPTHSLSPNAVKFVGFLNEGPARRRLRADGLEAPP
jgi:molybdate transport system substrate-binding protein